MLCRRGSAAKGLVSPSKRSALGCRGIARNATAKELQTTKNCSSQFSVLLSAPRRPTSTRALCRPARSFSISRGRRCFATATEQSSKEVPQRQHNVALLVGIVASGAAALIVGVQAVHAEEQNAKANPSAETKSWWTTWYEYFVPTPDTVLLPPQQEPYAKKYTLVISDDSLLYRQYTIKEGQITKKRPGTEYFLASLAALDFEVVLWSLQGLMMYAPIIEKLDPNHHAPHRLFLDSTTMTRLGPVKDLTRLNRDMTKVIAIDTNADGVEPKANLILIPKYTGEPKDTTLLDIIPFLKYSLVSGKDDVREWVAVWDPEHPDKFKALWDEVLRKHRERQQQHYQAQTNAKVDDDEDEELRSFSKGRRKF